MLVDWLDSLNDRQRQAVTHGDGPLLILAGAGSGKTRALTHRIAYLIHARGVDPTHILAVTFTNKAAGEMKERVKELLGAGGPAVWVATFHSTCARILRVAAPLVGRTRDFVIYNTADQRGLVRDILAELRWDAKKFPPAAFLSSISEAKNELLSPEAFAARAAGEVWVERTARVYRAYQNELERNNALDFDDLILKVVELWEKDPAELARYQERFRYLLVDEYQDTNHAQYRLVRALAARYRNLSVVGDDDQSIYAFRGADTRNILEFERDYPDAKVVKLEQNYRSTATVLAAANSLVRHNDLRKGKRLWTENPQGEPIQYYQAQDQRDEAVHVAAALTELRAAGESLGQSVVLYRTNAQSRALEEALLYAGLPYQIVGGHRFYDRKHIRDALAYLRLIVNPADAVSLRRVVNTPRRGVGPATWGRLVEAAQADATPVVTALLKADDVAGLRAATRRALVELGELLRELIAARETITPEDALVTVLKRTGYLAELEAAGTSEARDRLEDLDELRRLAAEHAATAADPSLAGFLEGVALVSDADTMEDSGERALLMTIHTAKGLEFDNVVLVGMDEGLFPHQRSMWDKREVEEERRLCYVAITRARRRLFLSSASARVGYGGAAEPMRPSRFIGELPDELIKVVARDGSPHDPDLGRAISARAAPGNWRNAATAGRRAAAAERRPVRTEDIPAPAEKVMHPKWGEGTVINVVANDDPANTEITVAFPELGIKRLLAGFARLEKLEPGSKE